MEREQRWMFKYAVPTANGNWNEKVIYPKSKESIENNKALCEKYGYKFISCKKLYTFNTNANQHNFELISNICYNTMHDMESGEIEWDSKQYDELEKRKERAEYFFCQSLPIAWLTWEEWVEAKDLAEAAIHHRQEACIKNGRLDLLQYC